MTPLLPIYPVAGIREVERTAMARLAGPPLMERAGRAGAELARELVPDGKPILVLAGPGNNGGDALVAARYLRQGFHRLDVVFAGNEARLPPDAARAMQDWRAAGGSCVDAIPERREWGLVIDGLFGIGLARPPQTPYLELIQQANALGVPILALDVPSGLDADNGQALGPTIRADHTVTFLALKPGLLTADGPDHCGQIHLRTLEVMAPMYHPPPGWLLAREMVSGLLAPRPLNSHKGSFGAVGILGGAPTMTGAPLLAGRAALRLGAGRVYVAHLDEQAPGVDALQPELMLRRPPQLFEVSLSCLVVGPGLGLSALAGDWLAQALARDLPMVLDADALNLIGASPELQAAVAARTAPTLLTPHPAEAARLLAVPTRDVLHRRLEVATTLATRFNAFVALKGVGTVCAMPNGTWFINASGNPGLASAGTGDVLSGMIAAFLAQGLSARDALLLGVHLHGAAADALVERGVGPIGLTASEIIDAARALLNAWVYGRA